MKMIKITTDNQISAHEFPEGAYMEQNRILREHIGPKCELYEHVMPKRLYEVLGGSRRVTSNPGECVSMLVDEDDYFHDLEDNMVGSWLYETDKHMCPIKGNILIIGEYWEGTGINFSGMSEEQFSLLYPKLEKIVEKARKRT